MGAVRGLEVGLEEAVVVGVIGRLEEALEAMVVAVTGRLEEVLKEVAAVEYMNNLENVARKLKLNFLNRKRRTQVVVVEARRDLPLRIRKCRLRPPVHFHLNTSDSDVFVGCGLALHNSKLQRLLESQSLA